jgi:alkanesulfonate monooxygenase SsuD/methylene tetrahydromethanopterin reductase-like flavin-dependent oxidoreductase (luciferase family)
MQVGISLSSTYAVDDVRSGARWMIERARAAESAGLDSLFVGDHHATPRPYYQNTPILGRTLAEWGSRTAGALYLLPLWHPVLLAEQVATLACIAQGPFVLQCAVGAEDHQRAAFGVPPGQRPSRFEESLAIVRRLWAGEPVKHSGRWQIEVQHIRPLPPEPIAVWIGATAPAAIDRAARLGDGWIASPGLPPAAARRQLAQYHERCAAHGRAPGAAVIRRDIYIGSSAADAEAVAGPVLRAGYRGFPPGATVTGDIDSVSAAFAELAEMGYDQVLVRNLVPDQRASLATIERLAEVRARVAAA